MPPINYLLSIGSVLLFTILWLVSDRLFIRIFHLKKSPITYDSACKAIDRMATFTTWLTGLQTAAMAAMGLLLKDRLADDLCIRYGYYALLFFGASIILSTWILASLPSIQESLNDTETPSPDNDIYMIRIFSFVPLRMGRFTGLIHTYFLVGIIFFARFIFHIMLLPPIK
jgi:hypothetical protein